MVNNNSYFYISGFISLSLFVFFVSLIIFMMFSSSKIDIYALKKENYISISLEIPKLKTSSKKNIVTPIDEQSMIEPNDVNIDDLFSDVWTKNIKNKKKKEKKIDNKRLQEIGKKSKKIDKNSVKKVLEKVDDNSVVDKSEKSHKDSTATEVNEYLAKIQALVYDNFTPPQNSQGSIVLARIDLSAIGKVIDFRILRYSSNEEMNKECDKIKNRLMSVLFPLNPDNNSYGTNIDIISEE